MVFTGNNKLQYKNIQAFLFTFEKQEHIDRS